MRLQPWIAPVVGTACAEMLLGLAEAASIRCVVLPRFLSMGSTTVRAIAPLAFALWTFADIGFEIGIVELRVVAHEASANATGVAFHWSTTLKCGLLGASIGEHSAARFTTSCR